MKSVSVKNLMIGEGIPKICVPITGRNISEIKNQFNNVDFRTADLIEWRADFFDDVFDKDAVREAMGIMVETSVGDNSCHPLLVTFRTKNEGGEKSISPAEYVSFYENVIDSGLADLIDLELFFYKESVNQLLIHAHEKNVKVIMSNHDFEKTPEKSEILSRLISMQSLGADITKIAVMPQSTADVITLLDATREMHELHADRPLITMSMGKLGVISRISGELFGSAITFGAVGSTSAPGQMDAINLKAVLEILHGYM
ncbi:MAG: type I 3-dehydroquinate dehydratase [Lachnospiraceae bacterium]|nr:type I 3-dehydroquinate dehydratase [Lachnospiraceae bacterium]